MAENDSGKILTSIKGALGLQPDYDPFDDELILHINSVITILNQLGVGPEEMLVIDADTPWSAFLPDDKVELAKSYMFLKVKMMFDGAGMQPSLIASYERLLSEMEFRLTVATDPMIPQTDGDIDVDDDEELILDGGGA